jgi:hypothetical protein
MSSSDSVRQSASIPDVPVIADPGLALSPDDASALDAIFERGLGGAEGQVYAADSRAARVARLLSLLDAPLVGEQDREVLIEATLARVTLETSRRASGPELVLVPDDEDALEALVSAEFNLARVPSGMRERATRHMSLLGLLGTPVGGDSNELVDRTLARVQSSIDADQGRLKVSPPTRTEAERGVIFSFVRSREILSVAALILVATALLTPLAQYFREYSRRSACASNMAAAGVAFGQYASANQDQLPLASASNPGNLFWNVGKRRDQSNSANLFVLRVQQLANVEELSCAGQLTDDCRKLDQNAWDWQNLSQVSFSYQNMFAKARPSWSASNGVVVLADASPVIRRAVRGEAIYPFENSANHMRRGQNVLVSDGGVKWLTTPVLANNDNIWLPRSVEEKIAKRVRPHEADPLHGTESPFAADDVFVGP